MLDEFQQFENDDVKIVLIFREREGKVRKFFKHFIREDLRRSTETVPA